MKSHVRRHQSASLQCEGEEHRADWQEGKIRRRERDIEVGERERRWTGNEQERQRRRREKRREEGQESKRGIEGEKLRERGWELHFLAQIRENPAERFQLNIKRLLLSSLTQTGGGGGGLWGRGRGGHCGWEVSTRVWRPNQTQRPRDHVVRLLAKTNEQTHAGHPGATTGAKQDHWSWGHKIYIPVCILHESGGFVLILSFLQEVNRREKISDVMFFMFRKYEIMWTSKTWQKLLFQRSWKEQFVRIPRYLQKLSG